MNGRNYFSYILNPLELLRTKKVLQVNPTIQTIRKDAESTRIYVYDYDKEGVTETKIEDLPNCYKYIDTSTVSWINI